MTDFITFKAIRGLNVYRKPIQAAITVALFMGLLAGCEEAYTPSPQQSVRVKEPIKVSASDSAEISVLSQQIRQLVKSLEYSDKVAEDFANMVIGWKDAQGRPILITWKDKLANAKQECKRGKISKNHVAQIEESVIRELCHRIRKQFNPKEGVFELADVIEMQQANCFGYSQLIYIAGNATGLSVKSIYVLDPIATTEEYQEGHVACIIDLFDGQLVIVDLALFSDLLSKAFRLENQFVKVGNYWEIRNKENPLRIHRRIRLLDRNGLIAGIYFNRGSAYKAKGAHERAISDYTKAIEIDPRFDEAYNIRGCTHGAKGEYDQAILDYNKSIEIDPKCVEAYYNRGRTYGAKGQYDQAILDFAEAIEINPGFAKAYCNRGAIYAALGKPEEAKTDLLKAVELNPSLKSAVKRISDQFKLGL